ncbi:hypothetical protein WN943_029577 [Citrus x changshan-huyou]
MNEEMKSMKNNEVWNLVPLLEGAKPISCRWIFKTKRISKGNVERIIMALVAHFNLELYYMDVKTMFLNGDIDEIIYMPIRSGQNLNLYTEKADPGLRISNPDISGHGSGFSTKNSEPVPGPAPSSDISVNATVSNSPSPLSQPPLLCNHSHHYQPQQSSAMSDNVEINSSSAPVLSHNVEDKTDNEIYGDTTDEHIERAHKLCYDLVKEYESKAPHVSGGQNVGLEISHSKSCSNSNKYWDVDEFEPFRSQNKCGKVTKSELDRYLDEELLDSIPDFDILTFWKMHTSQYHILAELAKDISAIPVSTVASESTFSVGGRFLSPHRSKLLPDTLKALMCAQNWIWVSTSRGRVPKDEIFTRVEVISEDDEEPQASTSSMT